jgi:hypothetical protein
MSNFFTIKLPISRSLPSTSPSLVSGDSPHTIRRCVETLAYYFKREFHFDFPQFEASESPSDSRYVPYEVWLFHEEALDQARDLDDNPRRVIGAACFRQRPHGSAKRWALQWIWFHPYERRRGHLSRSWSLFKSRYRQFHVEGPLSDAMKRFLSKQRVHTRKSAKR